MIYHKTIELAGWKPAAFEVYKYVKEHTPYLQRGAFWNALSKDTHKPCYDALAPVFASAGFNLLKVAVLILNKPSADIHTDNDFVDGFSDRLARVNLPVLNCGDSETQFFSPIKWEPIIKTLGNGIKYTYHSPENCKFESSTSIIEPTILRVRELHNVVVHKESYPRIALTCAIDPDPVYLLEEESNGNKETSS